jgi:hypothetical protein
MYICDSSYVLGSIVSISQSHVFQSGYHDVSVLHPNPFSLLIQFGMPQSKSLLILWHVKCYYFSKAINSSCMIYNSRLGLICFFVIIATCNWEVVAQGKVWVLYH